MSGGVFEYSQYQLESIADDIEKVIQSNHLTNINKYGDDIGYFFNDRTITEFKQAVCLLRTSMVYARRINWLLSSDDNEDTFHKRLVEDLQKLKSVQ